MAGRNLIKSLEITASASPSLSPRAPPHSHLPSFELYNATAVKESRNLDNEHKQAVTDAPCANFAESLIKAYPEAKVVLTLRDPDKWVGSMERSYYQIFSWPSWRLLALLDPIVGTYNELLTSILKDWTGGEWENRRKLKQGFIDHNENIRRLVPKDRLLEFRVEEGWEPLCKFLGKEVPDEPYPRVNEGNNAANLHVPLIYITYAKIVGKVLMWPVLVGVGAAAVNWGVRTLDRGGR